MKYLKEMCEKSERFKTLSVENMKKYKKEIIVAKRFYNNGRNLFNELRESKNLKTQYVIPYLLNLTNLITDEKMEMVQVKAGASGGIDVDVDVQPSARERIYIYLKNKYGEDKVFHIITFSKLKLASATKDIMRVFKIGDFKTNNEFTKCLDGDLTFEENIQLLKAEHHKQYKMYLDNKEVFDIIPKMLNIPRGAGKHAGGIAILDRPIYDLIPVERINGDLVTAYQENGSQTDLDEAGIVKYDVLGITILDIIEKAYDLIDEKLYLIVEDGIEKIVSESYLDEELKLL